MTRKTILRSARRSARFEALSAPDGERVDWFFGGVGVFVETRLRTS